MRLQIVVLVLTVLMAGLIVWFYLPVVADTLRLLAGRMDNQEGNGLVKYKGLICGMWVLFILIKCKWMLKNIYLSKDNNLSERFSNI